MKKLIFGLVLFFTVATVSAQTADSSRTTSTKYWYYPSQNYYYNDATSNYWYYDDMESKWKQENALPSTYKVTDKDERYAVTYSGADVWKDNKNHKIKYKVKKDGTVKEKPAPATKQ